MSPEKYTQEWYRVRDLIARKIAALPDVNPLPVIEPEMLEGAPECSVVHQSALLWPRPEDVDEDNEPGGRGTA